ncbi:hypothetical protein C8R44DRAFT_419893 [Mycena epipterygia]|nr:hypothetical protein C8R44DRAFT_419893 [Mycena epipterygia]
MDAATVCSVPCTSIVVVVASLPHDNVDIHPFPEQAQVFPVRHRKRRTAGTHSPPDAHTASTTPASRTRASPPHTSAIPCPAPLLSRASTARTPGPCLQPSDSPPPLAHVQRSTLMSTRPPQTLHPVAESRASSPRSPRLPRGLWAACSRTTPRAPSPSPFPRHSLPPIKARSTSADPAPPLLHAHKQRAPYGLAAYSTRFPPLPPQPTRAQWPSTAPPRAHADARHTCGRYTPCPPAFRTRAITVVHAPPRTAPPRTVVRARCLADSAARILDAPKGMLRLPIADGVPWPVLSISTRTAGLVGWGRASIGGDDTTRGCSRPGGGVESR